MKIRWERLNSDLGQVCRLKVPNGWLVCVFASFMSGGRYGGGQFESHAALAFYPDEKHDWESKQSINGTKTRVRTRS